MTETNSVTEDIVYTARVRATGGRAGAIASETGELALNLARPAERGTGAGTDPEELFAAGYAACFDSALTVVARRERISLGATTTTVSVSLVVSSIQSYRISVAIHVDAPSCGLEDVERAVAAADQTCPYSLAIRGNVEVALTFSGLGQ